jgi:hypothetical protein
MRKLIQRAAVGGTVFALAATGAGVAYAFVSASGSGSASQAVASSNAYSLQVTVSQATNLAPGVPATITVTVTNKGPAKVKVSTATLSLPSTVAGVDSAALATVNLGQPTSAPTVLDKNGTTTFTGSITIEDSATVDQTSLLGASLPVTASVS